MTTMNEVLSTVTTAYPDAVMVRRSGSNFLAVPGEVVDGKQTYLAVKVSALLAKGTKTVKAFDLEAGVAEYEEYAAKQAEKSSAPKKFKGADPEKQAAKERRKASLYEYMVVNGVQDMTATDLLKALPDVYEGCSVMTVGSDLKELAADGKVSATKEKSKNFWSVAKGE